MSNSQLVFPTFEQFLILRCGMAIVSWGWNLVHRSPLRWQRTCWRPHSSFLCLRKYVILFRHCRHMARQRVCVTRRFDFSTAFTVDLLKHLWYHDRDLVQDEISNSQLYSSAYIFNLQNWISTRILGVCKHEFRALNKTKEVFVLHKFLFRWNYLHSHNIIVLFLVFARQRYM